MRSQHTRAHPCWRLWSIGGAGGLEAQEEKIKIYLKVGLPSSEVGLLGILFLYKKTALRGILVIDQVLPGVTHSSYNCENFDGFDPSKLINVAFKGLKTYFFGSDECRYYIRRQRGEGRVQVR